MCKAYILKSNIFPLRLKLILWVTGNKCVRNILSNLLDSKLLLWSS